MLITAHFCTQPLDIVRQAATMLHLFLSIYLSSKISLALCLLQISSGILFASEQCLTSAAFQTPPHNPSSAVHLQLLLQLPRGRSATCCRRSPFSLLHAHFQSRALMHSASAASHPPSTFPSHHSHLYSSSLSFSSPCLLFLSPVFWAVWVTLDT